SRTLAFRVVTSFFLGIPHPTQSTLFPYTTLFRSRTDIHGHSGCIGSQCIGAIHKNRHLRNPFLLDTCGKTFRNMHNNSCVMFNRSEEHTSELQSRENLVCRLLLEKKKQILQQQSV